MQENQNNLVKYMTNPKAFILKRWFSDLIKGYMFRHETIIERIATSLATDKDVQDFGNLMSQVFEMGYRKAVDDYRGQFEKMGLKIEVVPGGEESSN